MFRCILVWVLLALLAITATAQQWKILPSFQRPRANFQGIQLRDGRFMIIGGITSGGNAEPTAELFDPATNTWKFAAPPHVAALSAYTLLQDGRVFKASGLKGLEPISMSSVSEIYDPLTDRWDTTTSMLSPREAHGAITLPNGKVLLAGGFDPLKNAWYNKAELYDPLTKQQSYTGAIAQVQDCGSLFYDSTSNVVIMQGDHYGGGQGVWLSETEEYNVATGTWAVVAHSSTPHGTGIFQTIQLPSGEILAISGVTGPANSSAPSGPMSPLIESYNVQTKTWRTVGTMTPRAGGLSFYLGNDSVIVIGGLLEPTAKATNTTLIINLKTGEVTSGPSLNIARGIPWGFLTHSIDPADPCSDIIKIYVFGGTGEFSNDGFNNPITSCEMLEIKRNASTLLMPSSLSFSGNSCNSIDTAITLTAHSCSQIVVRSCSITGIDGASISADELPRVLSSGQSLDLQLRLHANTPGQHTGIIHISYSINGKITDTTIAVTFNATASSKGTIRSVIHDINDGGDTVVVPIYLAINTHEPVHGFDISIDYTNPELLQPLDPDFTGTLFEQPNIWDKNIRMNGLDIFAERSTTLSFDKSLVNLRFKTKPSQNGCATITIRNIDLLFDSTGTTNGPCTYDVLQDSATICRADAGVEGVSGLVSLSARFNRSSNTIDITGMPYSLYTIEISTILGQMVAYYTITDTHCSFNAEKWLDGVYIVRVADLHGAKSIKVLIRR